MHLLEVGVDPPSLLVDPFAVGTVGISSRIGGTSDEFIPSQPRFTAATCT